MTAEIVVFVGPTISAETVRQLVPAATVVGPAMCTDVYLHALRRPLAIGIIDGVFESVPAIFHKEILWALEEGIHVLGASSMGAIRAAELDTFGMKGLGVAYELLAGGDLDDDDVAVAHAGPDLGYRALSEPLVNLHVTLLDAVSVEVLEPAEALELRSLAKARYYPERSFRQMIDDGLAAGHDRQHLQAFERWLVTGRRDVKREDAILLLEALTTLRNDAPACPPHFRLNPTVFFRALQQVAERRATPTQGHNTDLLEELRLLPDEFTAVRQRAEARMLALELARIDQHPIDQESVDEASDIARFRIGLLQPEALDAWLVESGLTFEQYARIVRDEAHRSRVADVHEVGIDAAMIDELVLTDRLRGLRTRAQAKAAVLAHVGLNDGARAPGLPSDKQLVAAFFSSRQLPHCGDLDADASACGFRDGYALLRALRREWSYVQMTTAALPPETDRRDERRASPLDRAGSEPRPQM